MPFGLGIWEILILAGVLVLLFGAKGAPAMARRLGTGVREMKDAVTEMDPRSVFDEGRARRSRSRRRRSRLRSPWPQRRGRPGGGGRCRAGEPVAARLRRAEGEPPAS